ncbi:hypothetical protein AK812_SmicGene44046 [Symbiodinium microadriaticum]|uniref:Uncharacterized protein n=1 Tax=Symbiodinium microadriaticum TaxID=2951 RepID=A0A1Q9BZH8_SYMMI|nr:hypothetical protein AK812_SmicGene44046 [Symbiodinium microadriaticum]
MAPKRRGGKESKVELYNHLAKNLLRPFPDAAGNFLWLKRSDKAQREQDMLKPAYLAKTRAVENCEALSRMSTYLSEEGATISNAANYLGNSPTVEKLGLDFFQTLGSSSGQKFVKACAFFDKDDSSSKDAGSVDGHVDAYIDFLSSDGDTKIKKARRMVLAGARAYLCGMSFLEQAALVRHPEIWASKVVVETQQASAREFRKKPTCKRLRQVLKDSALSLLEAVEAQSKRKKRAALEASSHDSPVSSSSKASGSSDVVKKKDKKSAKKRPPVSSDSSNENHSSPSNKKRKTKDEKKDKKQDKKDKRGGKESKVELYNHLAKNLLRPFPDAAGNFLWLKRSDKAQREQDMLKPAYLAKTRAVENCEALSRMSTYLSEEGATISNAANYLGNSPTVEKLGLDFFHTLGSSSGQKFVKACAFFDKDDSSSKDAGSVDGHVDAYIDFLSSDGDTKIKKARRMVLAGARAYLCGMSFLEQAALVRHPEIWASKVVVETQQASAREFRKKPTCKRLRQVLKDSALSLLEAVEAQSKRKKRAALEASSHDSPVSSSSKSSGSSDVVKKKDKKSAKKRPPVSSDSSNENHSSPSNKKRKTKDEKKDKKQDKKDKTSVDKKDKLRNEKDFLADQTAALMTWQLSEIQSAAGEWEARRQDFLGNVMTSEEFEKYLHLIPEAVRQAFQLQITKLPKEQKREGVLQRILAILEAGKAFWAAQQVVPISPADAQVEQID